METNSQPHPEKSPLTKGTPLEWLMRPDMTRTPPPPLRKPQPNLFCFADLPDRPEEWIWPGRIPAGALTLICGDPGRGKSLVALDVAARVSAGLTWPDGGPAAEPADVLILSAEDSIGGAVRRRLVAQGADLRRVYYLNAGLWYTEGEPFPEPAKFSSITAPTTFGDVPNRAFHALWRDAHQLRAALEAMPDCRLVVIDPVAPFLHLVDLQGLDEVRLSLAPLATFADHSGAAILAVVHRDPSMQGPLQRRYHTLRALADMARAIHLIDRDAADPSRRLMLPVKNNFGDSTTAVAFEVVEGAGGASKIQWSPHPISLTDDPFLGPPVKRPRPLELDRAVAWLQGALAAGPIPSQTLIDQAAAAGISERNLKRARAKLRTIAFNDRKIGGRWMCALPEIAIRTTREGQEFDLAPSTFSAPSTVSQIPEGFAEADSPEQDEPILVEPNSVN